MTDAPPPPASPIGGSRSRLLPVGLALVVAGLVLGSVLGVLGAQNFPDIDAFPRASGDGVPVMLTTGEWTVFSEGGPGGPPEIVGPDGQPIAVDRSSTSETYESGGRSGRSVGRVDAPADGTYLVTTAPGQTVAFAEDFASQLVIAILLIVAAVLTGGILVLVGAVLALIGFLRQRRGS